MCGPAAPAAAAWIMAATAVVGGVVSYRGQQNAQDYNEAVAKQNKKIAEAKAIDEERLGQIEASEKRLETRMKIASQVTGFGAQNVEQTGTALDILGDTAMFGEIDESRIRANAARRAWGYRMEGHNIDAQTRLSRYTGRVERMGTILTTIGSAASSFGGRG